jgi:hypothetical protein
MSKTHPVPLQPPPCANPHTSGSVFRNPQSVDEHGYTPQDYIDMSGLRESTEDPDRSVSVRVRPCLSVCVRVYQSVSVRALRFIPYAPW